MTLTTQQAHTVLNLLQPFSAHAPTDKHPETPHTYGDMWQAYPDQLRNHCVTEHDLKDHAGGLYCGMDRNAMGQHVMVFQKSLLEAYIKSLEPAPVAKVAKWHSKDGEHDVVTDAEIAERIAKLREAEHKNTKMVEAEYRRDHVAPPQEDGWQKMVSEENQAVEGLGDRDEAHHAKEAKKLKKKRQK